MPKVALPGRSLACLLPEADALDVLGFLCLFDWGWIHALHLSAVRVLSLLIWALKYKYVAVYVIEMSTAGHRRSKH